MEKAPGNMQQHPANKLLNWFLKNKDAFNISYVAKTAGVPHSTLDKWVKGMRPLPGEWVEPLTKWVKEFKK